MNRSTYQKKSSTPSKYTSNSPSKKSTIEMNESVDESSNSFNKKYTYPNRSSISKNNVNSSMMS
jgi:hypothetical protein